MIWQDDEEIQVLTYSKNQVFFRGAERMPPGALGGSYAQLNADVQSEIANIKSDIYHKTVGYGLIAVGAGVLVATRGVGWKPAAVIMSTGLNNLAEVN